MVLRLSIHGVWKEQAYVIMHRHPNLLCGGFECICCALLRDFVLRMTWGLSHKVPGSNPGPALKLTGGPEHWLGTALVPPLTHESTTDPHTSQRTAYSLALHRVHRCLSGEM